MSSPARRPVWFTWCRSQRRSGRQTTFVAAVINKLPTKCCGGRWFDPVKWPVIVH